MSRPRGARGGAREGCIGMRLSATALSPSGGVVDEMLQGRSFGPVTTVRLQRFAPGFWRPTAGGRRREPRAGLRGRADRRYADIAERYAALQH